MKKFKYCMNHKEDEAYMEKMCREGWAATSLVEGIWTFEPCSPGQYHFRVCYLRGKSSAEVEVLKRELAAKGIEFVSRYSFWGIFRSEHAFMLYTPEEELEVCSRIYQPMPWGSLISWLAFFVLLMLSLKISAWFLILAVLLGIYAIMCTCLGISYKRLLRRLKQ